MIELDKLLAARKVAFKLLQSHVTDAIVLQFGKQDFMVESVKSCNLRHDLSTLMILAVCMMILYVSTVCRGSLTRNLQLNVRS